MVTLNEKIFLTCSQISHSAFEETGEFQPDSLAKVIAKPDKMYC